MGYLDNLNNPSSQTDAEFLRNEISGLDTLPADTLLAEVANNFDSLSYHVLNGITLARKNYQLSKSIRKRNEIGSVVQALSAKYAKTTNIISVFNKNSEDIVDGVADLQSLMTTYQSKFFKERLTAKQINASRVGLVVRQQAEESIANSVEEFRKYYFENNSKEASDGASTRPQSTPAPHGGPDQGESPYPSEEYTDDSGTYLFPPEKYIPVKAIRTAKNPYPVVSAWVNFVNPRPVGGKSIPGGVYKKITSKGYHAYPAIDYLSSGINHFPGPAYPFKVNFAGVDNTSYKGSRVEVEMEDGSVILFGHFTSISNQVKKEVGTGVYLPAGTYIGTTEPPRTVGMSTGAHAHIQGWSKKTSKPGTNMLLLPKINSYLVA